MTKKPSFFERLSGSATITDAFDEELSVAPAAAHVRHLSTHGKSEARTALHDSKDSGEGQLPVDVHQTASEIVIRAFVAGVRPDELSISISRDMVVIEGSRMSREQISEPDYFSRELFWGSFTRTILLPQEVDVDNSAASAKDGLLSIILPKLDKARQTKLRVKAG